MALATDTTPGEIQLTGDLAGDGGSQTGSSPQLTHISGLTPGQYINAKITVDAKGRITAIQQATPSEIGGGLPVASASDAGVVSIGDNINITSSPTNGYQDVDFGGNISAGTDATGLDTCATFTVNIQVDGGTTYTVSNTGANLSTIQDIIDEINGDTTGVTATISSGNIRVSSDTSGRGSLINISNDTLFKCVTNYVEIDAAVAGTDTCELYVLDGSDSQKGVVQIGSGIDVTDGVISVNLGTLPIATSTTLGAVIVPTSNGLSVDGSGNVSMALATESSVGAVQVGNGLDVDLNGVVSVDLTETSYAYATESSAGIMQVGNGLDVSGGIVTVDLSELTLDDATTSSKGIVQIGTNIDVASGVISVADATGASKGVMQTGTGLTATSGVVNLDIASAGSLGGIKVGTGLSIDGTGVLSATTVPDATTSSKGIVQIGTNIDVASGVISVADATGASKGVVQVGTNIDVASGVISVATADNTTLGLAKSANTNNITITAGAIDVGSDILTTDTANTFTKAQVVSTSTLSSSGTISVDASNSNVFTSTLTGNATLANPTNMVAGQTIMFVLKQDAGGGNTLGFGTAYKFRTGATPSISSGGNKVDLMSCVSDGTNLYCSYNKDFS